MTEIGTTVIYHEPLVSGPVDRAALVIAASPDGRHILKVFQPDGTTAIAEGARLGAQAGEFTPTREPTPQESHLAEKSASTKKEGGRS